MLLTIVFDVQSMLEFTLAFKGKHDLYRVMMSAIIVLINL